MARHERPTTITVHRHHPRWTLPANIHAVLASVRRAARWHWQRTVGWDRRSDRPPPPPPPPPGQVLWEPPLRSGPPPSTMETLARWRRKFSTRPTSRRPDQECRPLVHLHHQMSPRRGTTSFRANRHPPATLKLCSRRVRWHPCLPLLAVRRSPTQARMMLQPVVTGSWWMVVIPRNRQQRQLRRAWSRRVR